MREVKKVPFATSWKEEVEKRKHKMMEEESSQFLHSSKSSQSSKSTKFIQVEKRKYKLMKEEVRRRSTLKFKVCILQFGQI